MQGLDYNTQRSHLMLPEYGRIVQDMVKHAMTIEDKELRQAAAEKIIKTMGTMSSEDKSSPDFQHKLWNHLAIISDFKLDIDYPYNVEEARVIMTKPQPLAYPNERVPVRHYGKLLHETCEIIAKMPEGEERDELARSTANQMRRMLLEYGHTNAREESVFHDIEKFTHGTVELNPATFRFDRTVIQMEKQSTKNKKKNKKK
ncbi:MAG: DUF4290 domain-containing protein [Prevotella sp.]|nr:DUF4290 domain-containing protein [Prevotella sp.]